MRSLILSLLGLFIILSANAQRKEPFNSGAIIKKGVALHDEGKYKEALKLYQQVPRNDSNYSLALYESSLSYYLDSNFNACKKVCVEGLSLTDKSNELNFYINLGSALDNNLESERAIRIYDSAKLKYPNAPGLDLNKSITLIKLKKYSEAEAILKNLLIKNPYYASAHFYLGKIALIKGQIIPATLSLFTYMICAPNGSYSSNVINTLSSISKSSDEIRTLISERKEQPAANFASIEQIMLSKIALDKNYKSLVSLDDEIFRQLQVVCEKLKYDPSNDDFWMQFYVPVFKSVFEQHQFEPVIFQAFSGVQLDAIKRYVKSNSKEINKAVQAVTSILTPLRSTRELNFIKRGGAPELYHFDDDVFFAKGRLSSTGKLNGAFEFYFPNGNLKSAGTFDDKEKKQGEWKFYKETGELSSIEHWEHGAESGSFVSYHINGNIKEQALYQNGKLEGEKKHFFLTGILLSIEHYKNDQLDGLAQYFSADGRKTKEVTYKNGEIDGHEISYYKNGQIETDAIYVNGKYNGLYKSYYKNGQVSFECNYVLGKGEGLVKNYHENGKISKERTYKNDIQIGEERNFNDEGILTSILKYENGKVNGEAKYYDDDSKLFCTLVFDKDILKSAHYFNKEGKEISVSERNNKGIDLTTFNEYGIKTFTVRYDDKGNKQGTETFFYSNGGIREVNNYKDGKATGVTIGYYPDGQKEYEIPFTDGEKDGYTINYHPNGKIKSTGWYSNGTMNDGWEYFDLKGNITDRDFYASGDFNGIQEHYFPNGKLSTEEVYNFGWINALSFYDTANLKIHTTNLKICSGAYEPIYANKKPRYSGTYKSSELDGNFKGFYFDGSLLLDRNYDRGSAEGKYANYYYGGQVSSTGTYKWNEKVGKWNYFFANGKIRKEENYTNGELNGIVTTYYLNGQKEKVETYKDGERNGPLYSYTDAGELIGVYYYKDGEITGYSYEGKDGKLVPAIPLPGGNGRMIMRYKNGTHSFEADYKTGKINGEYSYYFPDGKLYYQSAEVWGNTLGKLVEYYPNGQQRFAYNYYYNEPDGNYKEFYSNGKLKEEGNLYLGDYHGTRKLYNENGTLLQKEEYYYGTLLSVTK